MSVWSFWTSSEQPPCKFWASASIYTSINIYTYCTTKKYNRYCPASYWKRNICLLSAPKMCTLHDTDQIHQYITFPLKCWDDSAKSRETSTVYYICSNTGSTDSLIYVMLEWDKPLLTLIYSCTWKVIFYYVNHPLTHRSIQFYSQ